MVSRRISHYRVIKKLGAGGLGEVYLAEDARLRRKVALKLLSADLVRNEGHLRGFYLQRPALYRHCAAHGLEP